MPIIIQNKRLGDWLLQESEAFHSRGVGKIASGVGIVRTGMALGRVLVGAASAVAFAGNAGNGTMSAITVGAGAIAGVYKLYIVEPASNAGKFVVEDPTGKVVDIGTVAVPFSAGGLGFTLADGGTDFAAGDGFDITVAAGSQKLKPWTPDGTDGTQILAAFLIADKVDATVADVDAAILVRDALVDPQGLGWSAAVTTQNHRDTALAQAKTLGILSRTGA